MNRHSFKKIYFIFCLVILLFIKSAPAMPSGVELSVETIYTSGDSGSANKVLSFRIDKTTKADVSLENDFIVVTHKTKEKLASTIDAYNSEVKIIFADFNFDSFTDIALSTSVGYMGVNVYYDIFLYDESNQTFSKLPNSFGNPTLDNLKKELITSEKSGPQTIGHVYQFQNNKPYLSCSSILLQKFDAKKITLMNQAGKATKSIIVSSGSQCHSNALTEKNIESKIYIEKAPLYSEPNSKAVTKKYLLKNDNVFLLDYQINANDPVDPDWLLIQYNGKSTTTLWLPASSLSEVN